jgi:predicted transposase YdaD
MAEQKSPIIKEAKEEYEEILSEGILKEIKEYEETSRLEMASYGYRVKKDIAIKLLKKGLDIDFIHQTTNLSIDKIKELQKNL